MDDCKLCDAPIEEHQDKVEFDFGLEVSWVHLDCAKDENESRSESAHFDRQYRYMEVHDDSDSQGDW